LWALITALLWFARHIMGLVNPSIQEFAFNMIGAALKSHYLRKRHSLLVWPPAFNAASLHVALQQCPSSGRHAFIWGRGMSLFAKSHIKS
jgi:hypothetical protein